MPHANAQPFTLDEEPEYFKCHFSSAGHMSGEQSNRLPRLPGSFDQPTASALPSTTDIVIGGHSWELLSDFEQLQTLREVLRAERESRRSDRASAHAARHSRTLTPPLMPSESDTPARRMRNILRQVGVEDARRSYTNYGGADLQSHGTVQTSTRSSTPESDEAASDALGYHDVGQRNHQPVAWPDPSNAPRGSRRPGTVQASITGVPSWGMHRSDFVRNRNRSAEVQNARWDARAASERVDRQNQQLRHLLQLPIPSSSLRRPRPNDDDDDDEDTNGGAGRHKRARFEDDSTSKAYYPITYGHEGQVVAGKLKMQLVSTDGGIVDSSDPLWDRTCSQDKYAAANVLRDDLSVYCTLSSHCNMVFQHRGQTPFTLQKLIIKGPITGYTDPVQEGLVFASLHQDDIFEATKRYQVHQYPTSRLGSLFQTSAWNRGQAPLGGRMTRSTPPPAPDEERFFSYSHIPDSDLDDEDDDDNDDNDDNNAPSVLSGSDSPGSEDVEDSLLGDGEDADEDALEPGPEVLQAPNFLGLSAEIPGQMFGTDNTRFNVPISTGPYNYHAAGQSRQTANHLHGPRLTSQPRVEPSHRSFGASSVHTAQEARGHARRPAGFHQENRAVGAASGYCVMSQPDDHSAPLYLLMPEARFSMQSKRSASCRPGLRKRHNTKWYTRVEARIHTDVNLGRPRNLAMVDEQGPRPTSELGTVLRTERTEHGGLVDFTHVRTTQTVQRDNTMTITFDPPISARFILLKLWNPEATGDAQEKRNIDIQSIQTIGWAGPRWFPAVDMR